MATVAATDETFDSIVKDSNLPVVVDFWAEWCGPCKQIGPALEELSVEMSIFDRALERRRGGGRGGGNSDAEDEKETDDPASHRRLSRTTRRRPESLFLRVKGFDERRFHVESL